MKPRTRRGHDRPIDLARVRSALATLDRVQAEHPEAFGSRTEDEWTAILNGEETEPMPKAKTTGKLAQGRPRSAGLDEPERGASAQIAVRFPPDLLARIDAWREAFNASNPGVVLTRSDAVRALVARALDKGGK